MELPTFKKFDIVKFIPANSPDEYTIAYVESEPIDSYHYKFKTIESKVLAMQRATHAWGFNITSSLVKFELIKIGDKISNPEYFL